MPQVDLVNLTSGEDLLFIPVDRGWIKATDLIDGTVDLAFVIDLVEAISVRDENQRRVDATVKP